MSAVTVDVVGQICRKAFKRVDFCIREGRHRIREGCHLRINFLLAGFSCDVLCESTCVVDCIHQQVDSFRRVAQCHVRLGLPRQLQGIL